MKNIKFLSLILIMICSTSCYHAKVITGNQPSAQIYDIPFASSWIGGLVPPKEVNASKECPNGVAIVETELSFVNMVVGAITLGIYTPMHIKVTCATGSATSLKGVSPENQFSISSGSTSDEIVEIFRKAGERAVELNQTVYVQYE